MKFSHLLVGLIFVFSLSNSHGQEVVEERLEISEESAESPETPQRELLLPVLENFSEQYSVSSDLLRDRFSKLQKTIPLRYNEPSHQYVEYFISKKPGFTRTVMERMPYYFPIFEKYLAKHNLPDELKYLAMIESGLNPRILSRVGAGGLWQFMRATGREMGLRQDAYIDERFDPEKSTEAACRYLKMLYSIFGDWEMALASYNAGPGTLKRAMRRTGGSDFWSVYPALPKETRSYVPQFVAITYMMHHGEEHGVLAHTIEYPRAVDTLHVHGHFDLAVFCSMSGIDQNELTKLNPQLLGSVIPEHIKGVVLKIPSERYAHFKENKSAILDSASYRISIEKIQLALADSSLSDSARLSLQQVYARYNKSRPETKRITHVVRKGETLSSIARKYRIQTSDLKKWNRISGSRVVYRQRLTIHVNEPAGSSLAASVPSKVIAAVAVSPQATNQPRYHTVQRGDTLWTISQRYGLPVDRLKKVNQIKSGNIRPGQKILISG